MALFNLLLDQVLDSLRTRHLALQRLRLRLEHVLVARRPYFNCWTRHLFRRCLSGHRLHLNSDLRDSLFGYHATEPPLNGDCSVCFGFEFCGAPSEVLHVFGSELLEFNQGKQVAVALGLQSLSLLKHFWLFARRGVRDLEALQGLLLEELVAGRLDAYKLVARLL